MKKSIFLVLLALVGVSYFYSNAYCQSKPLLYFCERYDKTLGKEVGQSSTFSTGRLTVMVKSPRELNLTDCYIQLDKYNTNTEEFKFYKKIKFTLTRDMDYVIFKDDELSFDDRGVYRVYLLDSYGETITASVIIIRGY
jgi:hypothetical protein